MQHRIVRNLRGFTLVELLVVILIISILLTMGSMAFKGAGGKGVTTALATTEALFDEGRSVAVGKGTRSRILIDVDDPSNEDNYLRRIAIAVEQLDDDGTPIEDNWKLIGRGYSMPDRTFFSRTYSKTNHESKTGDLDEMNLTGNGGLYNGRYVYYEFNSEGICVTGLNESGDYSGPSFVIGAGVRSPGGEPRTTSEGRRDFGGFVIWRNGSTAIFRDPSQIFDDEEPREF